MNVWVSSLNARFKFYKIFKKKLRRKISLSQVNAYIHKMAERFNIYEKKTMHLQFNMFSIKWNMLCFAVNAHRIFFKNHYKTLKMFCNALGIISVYFGP